MTRSYEPLKTKLNFVSLADGSRFHLLYLGSRILSSRHSNTDHSLRSSVILFRLVSNIETSQKKNYSGGGNPNIHRSTVKKKFLPLCYFGLLGAIPSPDQINDLELTKSLRIQSDAQLVTLFYIDRLSLDLFRVMVYHARH
jgi:hypothetical protein